LASVFRLALPVATDGGTGRSDAVQSVCLTGLSRPEMFRPPWKNLALFVFGPAGPHQSEVSTADAICSSRSTLIDDLTDRRLTKVGRRRMAGQNGWTHPLHLLQLPERKQWPVKNLHN
jgi:hypothetical protein